MPINPQQRIEITHDILARQVYQRIDADEKMRLKIDQFLRDRYDYYVESGALLEKRDLDYVGPYIDRVILSTEQKELLRKSEQEVNARAQRTRWRNLIIGAILLIAAVGSSYLGWQARKQSKIVDQKNEEVLRKNAEVEAQANRAEQALTSAREALLRDSLTNIDLLAALRSDSLTKFDLRAALVLAQNETTRAENETIRARRQADIAEARRLAGIASDLARQERFSSAIHIALLAYRSVAPPRPASVHQAFKRIVTSSWRGKIPIRTAAFNVKGTINRAEFSPDGDRLLFSYYRRVGIYDTDGSIVVDFPDSLESGFATYSPNGRYLAMPGKDNKAFIQDLKTGNRVPLIGHGAEVTYATFSPDGQYVLTVAFRDSLARVWDLRGNLLAKFGEPQLLQAYFSPDNQLLLSEKVGESPKLWNRDGSFLASLPYPVTYSLRTPFSPDGRWIATTHLDTIRLATPSGEVVTWSTGHDAIIRSLNFHPDSKSFVTTSTDATASVWNTQGGRLLRFDFPIKEHSNIIDAFYSMDGRRIVAWMDNLVSILDTSGTLLANIPTSHNTSDFRWVLMSPDGASVLTLTGSGYLAELWKLIEIPIYEAVSIGRSSTENAELSRDGRNIILKQLVGNTSWYTAEGEKVIDLPIHYLNPIEQLAFAVNGSLVFVILRDNSAVVWDSTGAESKWSLPDVPIRDVAFSPTNENVAYAAEDGTIGVYTTQGKIVSKTVHPYSIEKIRFTPNGRQLIAVTVKNTVIRCDLSGNLMQEFSFGSERFSTEDVTFSPNGHFLAFRAYNLSLRICDVRNGTCFTSNTGQNNIATLAFTPDSRFLLAQTYEREFYLVDLQTRQSQLTGTGLPDLYQLTFSPDNRYVAAVNRTEGLVQLWHPSGTLVANISNASPEVNRLAFTPDGNHLIVVDNTSGITMHPLPDTYVRWAEGLNLAPLLPGERRLYQLPEK